MTLAFAAEAVQKDCVRRSARFLLLLPFLLFDTRAARADLQRFLLNPNTSQVSATIEDPFGNSVKGALRLTRGEARGDPDRLPESAAVSLVIEVSSYSSNLGLRDQDVQNNYLEAGQYPVIRFDSTGMVKSERPASSAEPWLITLKGVLELHGVKREILVPIRLVHQTNTILAQGQFPLRLEEFNIAVPRLLFLRSGNRVQVEFRIEGERQP